MNLLRRRRAWTGLRERLCPRTHAPGEGPPGHLARVLNDDATAGRPESLFLLCGKDRAQLPERRLEARARQERRGGYAGKSREHDHYFPSHRNRLTGSFLESDASGVGDACIARHGPKSRCFLSFGCRKLGTVFTFACASVAWEEHLPECFGSPLRSSRRMTKSLTDGAASAPPIVTARVPRSRYRRIRPADATFFVLRAPRNCLRAPRFIFYIVRF